MKRILAALVRFYRSRLAGRGPLRGVVCTFHHTESCSAYGLRVATDPSITGARALSLIKRRLRRCADASVFRDRQRALAWDRLYDADDTHWAAAQVASHELDATRVALERARLAVARQRRDGNAARSAVAALARLPRDVQTGRAHVVVRESERAPRWLRRRAWLDLLFAALVAGGLAAVADALGASVATSMALGAMTFVAGLLRARLAWRRYSRLTARIDAAELIGDARHRATA